MEKNKRFIISGTNDKLWNIQEFIEYLSKNQHTHISLSINPEAICLDTLGVYRLLDNFKFNYYPYMDTMCYMDKEGIITNDSTKAAYYKMRGIRGENYYCPECGSNMLMRCPSCGGEGRRISGKCNACGGTGRVRCQYCANVTLR